MKKENILTYNDVETILIALMGRAMDERKRANTAENEKDDEIAEYHREQADECSRVISKLRDFVF